jgi:hypothetical protein
LDPAAIRLRGSDRRGPAGGAGSCLRSPLSCWGCWCWWAVIRIDALRNSAPQVPALGDARAYHLLAENLADGRGYIRPYEFAANGGQRIKTAEYPPGLPVLLAVATKAGASSETSQRVLLCGIGPLTVGLVGLTGGAYGDAWGTCR